MGDTDKFESYKIEIRSILLPFQKGCYLSEFNRTYFELIGKRLPFREMGFNSDIEFLYAMPDAVKITPMGRNVYHLMGVADDKSKHIQKMVARQKPAKLKPPTSYIHSTKFPRLGSLPPRFQPRKTQEPIFRYLASTKRPEMRTTILPKQEPKLPKQESKLLTEESKPVTLSPMDEVIALIRHFKDRLAIDDILCEYKRMYNKSLSLSTYGFSSIEECIHEISELEIIQSNNVQFVRYCPEKQAESNNDERGESLLRIPSPEVSSSYNSDHTYKQNSDNGNVPTSLEEKLLKVAEECSDGILASDFPHRFEKITGHTLDIINLGYRCLNDFIDEVPHIFTRSPVAGSKKDYLIYSTKNFKPGQKAIADDDAPYNRIALNLRKILVAYPEGIKLQDLINVYSINCKDYLHLKDFGFDDLEQFLLSIKTDVPLRFGSINGAKSIHLVKLSEESDDLSYMDPNVYDKEAIPYDAVFPEFKYKPHKFSDDFDFSMFIPTYTSSVAHAGHLYVQFQQDFGSSDELARLGTKIDNFYNGSGESEQYLMKTIHIQVGACCIAKWPTDNHWYRAQILSIPSMQSVKVIYVDYGTMDTIPKCLLRYTKKEFIDLPVQAVRCRLAFLKPPNNAPKWNVETRDRILKLCQDVPLMAKVEEITPDGVYSILLCDTNDDDDVYINDVLIKEGLAESATEPAEDNVVTPESKMHPDPLPCLHPLQALQAQYFLQAFAAVAPIFAQNELYLGLLKEVTTLCQNTDAASHSASIPFVPPGFNTYSQGFNPLTNSPALYNAFPNATPNFGTNPIRKSKANTMQPPKEVYSPSLESSSSVLTPPEKAFLENNGDIENEIFDDDDDEIFQQFCQKISLTNVRHVKRVMLGDGYKIHIIVIDSQPYASSGEISQLIWNNKEADYLFNRLQLKDVDIPFVNISEDGHQQLFHQLLQFNVKGVQKTNGFKSSIVLYPLKDVMKILNIFGHPSVTLRTRLTEEISNFNLNDSYWRESDEFYADSEPEDEDSLSAIVYSSATDDDKIEKLCLYDLLAMKESIVYKRKKMLSSSDLCKSTDEIDKLEKLLQKVLNRIQEIKEICKIFS